MNRFFLFIIIFFYATNCCLAQKQGQQKIDSLEARLIQYKQTCKHPCLADSVKADLLAQLGFEYSQKKPYLSDSMSRAALKLSTEIGWSNGISIANNSLGWLYYIVIPINRTGN
jgi:uncharacterized membrane-anchored protein YhcB (DUF1043 family)